ncbi:MAG TPA: c-type cytochrome [Chloroflexi bacterium]|nr:c-type cytochrome [Chloroflexota bacterium]
MEVKDFSWNSLAGRMLLVVFFSLVTLVGYFVFGSSFSGSPAETGRTLFDENCQSCHTFGGGEIVGPDLQGIFDRREREWVARFITSPDWMIAEGDPVAMELLIEFNGVEMPNQALAEADVELIMLFLESQDSLTQAVLELPRGSAGRGESLFTGDQLLEAGGTPCMACHTVGGIGEYGGGTLGPDLTRAYERYGEPGLTSVMQNISFPAMKYVYGGKNLSGQEIADLLAFFIEADTAGDEGMADQATGLFWMSGIGGAVVLFGFMALFWPRQSKNQIERLRIKAETASKGKL